MNESESWKLQEKMIKVQRRDKVRKDTAREDVDVDPPDEYNRAIEGEDEC